MKRKLSWVLLFCALKLQFHSGLASSILVSFVALRLVQQQRIYFCIRIGRYDHEPFNKQFFHSSLREQLFLFQYWWWESSHSQEITAKMDSPFCCCLQGEEILSSQNWEAGVSWRLLIAAFILFLWPRKKYKDSYSLGLQHKHKNPMAQPFRARACSLALWSRRSKTVSYPEHKLSQIKLYVLGY